MDRHKRHWKAGALALAAGAAICAGAAWTLQVKSIALPPL